MLVSHVSHFFYIHPIYRMCVYVYCTKKHTRNARVGYIKTVGHSGTVGHIK